MIDADIFTPQITKSIITTAGCCWHTGCCKRSYRNTAICRCGDELIFIAHTNAYVTNNHIIAADHYRMIGQTNTISRSCLSGNGCITTDIEFRSKTNGSGYTKHNSAMCCSLCKGITQTANTVIIVEMCYFKYGCRNTRCSSSSRSKTTGTFCSGKSNLLCRCSICSK